MQKKSGIPDFRGQIPGKKILGHVFSIPVENQVIFERKRDKLFFWAFSSGHEEIFRPNFLKSMTPEKRPIFYLDFFHPGSIYLIHNLSKGKFNFVIKMTTDH